MTNGKKGIVFDASNLDLPFEHGLFSANYLPLAAYLEPDEFRRMIHLKTVPLKSFGTRLPRTYDIAKVLRDQLPQRWRWGCQKLGGEWVTHDALKIYKINDKHIPGSVLSQHALLKHFCGWSFCCGATDIAVDGCRWTGSEALPNRITCLRLDVDQNEAWDHKDSESVLAPARIQRQIVHSLGLPYRAFATGGRGFQAVIPLPKAIPHMLASLIEEILRESIELKMPPGLEGTVDKTSLKSLMRLPGGLHGKSNRLGAWIDIDAGRYFAIDEQAELMTSGLAWQHQPGSMTKQEFQDSFGPIGAYMLKQGFRFTDYLSRADSITILEHCSRRPMAVKLLQLLDLGSNQPTFSAPTAVDDPVPPSVNQPAATEEVADSTPPHPALPSNADRRWAQSVWSRSFAPGGFYNWISMDGERGILAAFVLFGEHSARPKLLEMARSVPCRSQDQLAERLRVIETFCSSFNFKSSQHFAAQSSHEAMAAPLEVDPRITQLAQEAVGTLLPPSGKVRWNLELGERILSIILQGINDSSIGFYIGSYDSLVRIHNATWSDHSTNRQRVCEMIKRFCESSSGSPLLYRLKGNNAAFEPDRYRCGRALYDSWLYAETKAISHHWLLEGRWGDMDEVASE